MKRLALFLIVMLLCPVALFSQGEVVNSWRQNLPNGGYSDYTQYADGSMSTITVSPCIICHGSKICNVCFGAGGRAGYGGIWYGCPSCAGTCVCQYCRGEGVVRTSTFVDGSGSGYSNSTNGYSAQTNPGGTIVQSPNGKTSAYPKGGSSSSSRSSGTCSACGGRKYQSQPYEHAAASASGWAQPYHSTSGSSCPYCKWVINHYHYPCNSCHGYGHK